MAKLLNCAQGSGFPEHSPCEFAGKSQVGKHLAFPVMRQPMMRSWSDFREAAAPKRVGSPLCKNNLPSAKLQVETNSIEQANLHQDIV